MLMHLDDRMTVSVEINFVNIKLICVTLFHVRGWVDFMFTDICFETNQ